MFIPVFALNKGHHYTRRLILRPISAARLRIDLSTKNPRPRGKAMLEQKLWSPTSNPLHNGYHNPFAFLEVITDLHAYCTMFIHMCRDVCVCEQGKVHGCNRFCCHCLKKGKMDYRFLWLYNDKFTMIAVQKETWFPFILKLLILTVNLGLFRVGEKPSDFLLLCCFISML